jgi:hypothetical protein
MNYSIKFNFMKIPRLMRYVFGVVVLAALGLVGCETMDIYSIGSPSDLQHRIDSIAAAKPNPGDTTFIILSNSIVGAEDNSSAWWTTFSDYFTIPANKLLHLEFVNYGTGVNNWNNWNLCLATAERDATDYSEYFTLRSDAYGWGNSDWNQKLVTNDYSDTDGDGDVWNDFRTTMNGAYVTMDIDHSVTGNVFVTATAKGTNGTTVTETYTQPVSATNDIKAFLICDGSHFVIKKAYLLPSTHTVIQDVNPVSISVTGAPSLVELGSTNFWGSAKATITYADGTTAIVDTANVSFNVIPDLSTIGKKTVVVAYSKTKQGAFCKAVTTYYTLDVVNPVVSLAVTTMPGVTTYTFPGPTAPIVNTTGLVVTATYSDGSTAVIGNENLIFTNPGGDGAQNASVSYVGATRTVTTTFAITNTLVASQQVGATDFTSAFWTIFSNEYNVASGSTKVFTMKCYSSGANNWNAPLVVLRKANLTEYAVVRMDSWGWGNGFGSAVKTSDWDWNVFAANINNSTIKITVTNAGDGTANIRYDVTYADGTTHFQLYTGIAVTKSDLNCAITIDGCYVQISSVQ